MQTTYSNALKDLLRWIDNINDALRSGMNFMRTGNEVQAVLHWVSVIQKNIGEDYPYYAKMLPQITSILFGGNGLGLFSINLAAFGELVIIIRHLEAEPNNAGIWNHVHPRIVKISKALYMDGHFDSAAEKAIKEVETRLREKFSELKPGVGVPSKIGDIIGALFSDNGIFQFCDVSNQSGKDHRKGIKLLFEGFKDAYRNPSAHANVTYTKREALEQITLASQLMYVLDKPSLS